MKKTLTILTLILILPSVYSMNEPTAVNLIESYYSAFSQKDVDKYLNTQFLLHLDQNQLKEKRETVKTILENTDVLSYKIDSFSIRGNNKGIYIASFVVNAKIGQIIDGKPVTLEYKKPMIALLNTVGDTPMIMQVLPAEIFDLQLSIAESSGLTSGYEFEDSKKSIARNILEGINGMFSKVKEMVYPAPETCGNYKCDSGETKRNCAQDCSVLTYNPDCGNGVCSEKETFASCPYDCAEIIPINETPAVIPEEKIITEEKPKLENKTLPICGDNLCHFQLNETCSSCPNDCGCISGTCIKDKCVVEPACKYDSDCDDIKSCTADKCVSAGSLSAYCKHEEIKDCEEIIKENTTIQTTCKSKASYKCYNDDVWYYDSCNVKETKKQDCESGCENNACKEVTTTTPTTTTTTFRSGTATLPSFNGGSDPYTTVPYSTFDFTRGRTIDLSTEWNDNDVAMLFGKAGDLGTACTGYDCPGLKKETSLTFNNMNSHPGGEADPHATPSVGDRYWVLMLDDTSRYGKIEILELQGSPGSYTGIKFKWAFRP